MEHNKKYTLCDYPCPLHSICARFNDSFDRKKTFHFGSNPYDYYRNKCNWFIKLDEDDIVDKINELLKVKLN